MFKLFNRSSGTFLIIGLILSIYQPAFAAKVEDLAHQPLKALSSLGQFKIESAGITPSISMKEHSREFDSKKNLHIRLQESYAGYPVWGGDVVVHVPQDPKTRSPQVLATQTWNTIVDQAAKGSMNGILYKDLDWDLQDTPTYIFEQTRADQVLSQAITHYQQEVGYSGKIAEKQARLMVYVDKEQKAHWAYFIQFVQEPAKGIPAKPTYIMDALSLEVYRHWDDIQPQAHVLVGGYGGNSKMGKLTYDGLINDLPALTIERNVEQNSCYLRNDEVEVKDLRKNEMIEKFFCKLPNGQHNNVYWHGSLDSVNGAYSPALDALYIGKIIRDLYQDWYGIPPLVRNAKPMLLIMRVHWDAENAYWDGSKMTFGDGGMTFYPMVSLGIGAHEVSHGFTQQHSGLLYYGQSGGLNESFSDMASQAAEFYVWGKSSWLIGAEIFKTDNKALRYMEHPSLDCEELDREYCSIERIADYTDDLNVHYSSGVFNRVFFLIANAPKWDTHKAFDVMVQANRYYWTPTTSFAAAACGVKFAAQDLGYPNKALINAFTEVGLDISQC